MEFSLATREVDGFHVVAATGELDVYTAPLLEEALGESIDKRQFRLVVDLSGVSFLDSTGLGLLVKALKWTREHDGALRIVVSAERILKVFRVTGLDTVMKIYPTLDEAVAAPED